MAGIIERLVDEAARKGAVADDRDRIGRVALEGLRHGQAVARRDGGAAVARRERIVVALLRVREAGEAAVLPECMELFIAAGQELVCVHLVSDVPDEGVLRGLELEMHGKRQLHRAEVRREVAAVFGDGIHDRLPDLSGQFLQLPVVQRAEVFRRMDLLQEFHFHRYPL